MGDGDVFAPVLKSVDDGDVFAPVLTPVDDGDVFVPVLKAVDDGGVLEPVFKSLDDGDVLANNGCAAQRLLHSEAPKHTARRTAAASYKARPSYGNASTSAT